MNLPIDFCDRVLKLRASTEAVYLDNLSSDAIRDRIRRGVDTADGFAALTRRNQTNRAFASIADGGAA